MVALLARKVIVAFREIQVRMAAPAPSVGHLASLVQRGTRATVESQVQWGCRDLEGRKGRMERMASLDPQDRGVPRAIRVPLVPVVLLGIWALVGRKVTQATRAHRGSLDRQETEGRKDSPEM
jgi:hypothetical protein